MKIIDSHAHLDHLDDIENALQRAWDAGVEQIVAVGVDLKANKKILELQKSFTQPRINVALGIHPGNINADEIDMTLQFIREHIHQAVAVGETGLDYWYKWVRKDEAKKEQQRQVFNEQLTIAVDFNRPIVIHSRGAWRDCLEMTQKNNVTKALFHWYSGPVDILKEILNAGYYVSTSPSIGYSPQSREAMQHAPLERILIETDCPVFYQTDSEGGGFKAEPKDVWRTLKSLAALKNLPEEEVLKAVNQNAQHFFTL